MLKVDEQDVGDLESFVFLSPYISRSGGTEEDILARQRKDLHVYDKLSRI